LNEGCALAALVPFPPILTLSLHMAAELIAHALRRQLAHLAQDVQPGQHQHPTVPVVERRLPDTSSAIDSIAVQPKLGQI
jgi:hypothetical protein